MRNVYHYHLRKCGGTSINAWLDLQVSDSRVWNPAWTRSIADWGRMSDDELAGLQRRLRAKGPAAFRWADIVHDHAPLRSFAPAGTFCFTVLREPRSRLVSQVADWRRLTPADRASASPSQRACMADAQAVPLAPFLARHGTSAGRPLLDNYLVRALAASRVGLPAWQIEDAAELLPAALGSLDDFDVVGLVERQAETRNMLCASLGWCPAPAVPHLNETRSSVRLAGEADDAAPLLSELTRCDVEVYRRASELFARQRPAASSYDVAAFEDGPAETAVRRLQADARDERVAFSVRQPLIGFGFHGRDAAGTGHCAVWTGPGVVSRLYMPVPPHADLTVFLWVRGYADESQRASLRVRADGRERPHRFEHEDGYRDVVAVDVAAGRGFLSLEVEVHAALATGEPGRPGHDARHRGLCFDRYGWIVRAAG